jgi:hypothetical protein
MTKTHFQPNEWPKMSSRGWSWRPSTHLVRGRPNSTTRNPTTLRAYRQPDKPVQRLGTLSCLWHDVLVRLDQRFAIDPCSPSLLFILRCRRVTSRYNHCRPRCCNPRLIGQDFERNVNGARPYHQPCPPIPRGASRLPYCAGLKMGLASLP